MAIWNNRKIRTLDERGVPIQKFWFHDKIFKSTYFDASSIVVPLAEKYIISLLDGVSDKIENSHIKQELVELREEENAHSQVHDRYNEMLEAEGYKIKHYQRKILRLDRFLNRHLSLKSRLAFCASVEHLTASSSLLSLKKKVLESGVDERMRKVWTWHFFEEIDHRANMFDIYQSFGGGYFRRTLIMAAVAVMFMYYSFIIRNGLLWQSGNFFNLNARWEGLKFLWGKNGFHKNFMYPLALYFLPGFHPNKIKYPEDIDRRAHRYRIEEDLMQLFHVSL